VNDQEPGLDGLLAAVARRLEAAQRSAPRLADPSLSSLAAAAVDALDVQAASIAVHDPVTDRLVFVAAAGPAAGDVVGLSIDAGVGIAGFAFGTGQPIAVADVAVDPRFDRSVAERTGYVPSTLLATPLIDESGTVGVLEALDRHGGTFTLRDLEIAGSLARAVTAAVRSGQTRLDSAGLLRRSIADLLSMDDSLHADPAEIDTLVSRVTDSLDGDDDPSWRLADRIARLRDVDPASVELAIEWLDALLRRRPGDERSQSWRAPRP
jgi:signal transduction protein with GAF and PtsI domain